MLLAHQQSPLEYVLLFSINKYRDIRLIASLRILSCFLEVSAALVRAKHKAFSLDFCSAVMMRVDEGDSVDSVADEGGDDDDDGDEGQDDEDEDDDGEKEGDDECDGDEPQRSRRFR